MKLNTSAKELKSGWLTVPFNGADKTPQYHSQAGQDLFVMSCLNGLTNGTYVELGCNEPYCINNTLLLEQNFQWKGLSVDFDRQFEPMWKVSTRKNLMWTADATVLNWDTICSTLSTNHIDYASFDLEPASITFKSLQNVPLDRVSFSVITYEHDAYRFGDEWRDKSRQLLTGAGYTMICGDVGSFEDWYINEEYVSIERVKVLIKEEKHLDGEKHLLQFKS
jgi:hypothetical protein